MNSNLYCVFLQFYSKYKIYILKCYWLMIYNKFVSIPGREVKLLKYFAGRHRTVLNSTNSQEVGLRFLTYKMLSQLVVFENNIEINQIYICNELNI